MSSVCLSVYIFPWNMENSSTTVDTGASPTSHVHTSVLDLWVWPVATGCHHIHLLYDMTRTSSVLSRVSLTLILITVTLFSLALSDCPTNINPACCCKIHSARFISASPPSPLHPSLGSSSIIALNVNLHSQIALLPVLGYFLVQRSILSFVQFQCRHQCGFV